MDKDLKVFRELVLWLWDNNKKPWEYPSSGATGIYNVIQQGFSSVPRREGLERLLPSEEQVRAGFPNTIFLYLDPVTDGRMVVPVLSIKCDFGRSIPEVRLQLGLFLVHEDKIRAFGYRFEAPEGQGSHHYYHAQRISGFQGGSSFPGQEFLGWLPTSPPTFPLDADNPVKLLLSLLISLYGLVYVGRLRVIPGLGIELDRYLCEMQCSSFKAIAWYWMVRVGSPAKYQEYYMTEKGPPEFAAQLRKKYPKCDIIGITQAKYVAVPKKARKGH